MHVKLILESAGTCKEKPSLSTCLRYFSRFMSSHKARLFNAPLRPGDRPKIRPSKMPPRLFFSLFFAWRNYQWQFYGLANFEAWGEDKARLDTFFEMLGVKFSCFTKLHQFSSHFSRFKRWHFLRNPSCFPLEKINHASPRLALHWWLLCKGFHRERKQPFSPSSDLKICMGNGPSGQQRRRMYILSKKQDVQIKPGYNKLLSKSTGSKLSCFRIAMNIFLL